MKEVTRIFTVRITKIGVVDDHSEMIPKEEASEILKNVIKTRFVFDDVVVDNVQDFIMDKEGEDND